MRRVDGRRIIGPIAPFRVAEVRVGPAIVRPARPWGPGVPHHGVPGPRTSPPRAGRKQLGSGNMARSGASSRAVSQSASCRAAALARVPGRRAKRRPGATEERSCRATADAECTAACRPGRAPPRGWSGFVRQRAHCSPEAQRTGGEPMTRSRRAARRRLLAGMKRAVRDYLRGAVPLSLTLAVVEIHRERAAGLDRLLIATSPAVEADRQEVPDSSAGRRLFGPNGAPVVRGAASSGQKNSVPFYNRSEDRALYWSGRQDLNLRPPGPEPRPGPALPAEPLLTVKEVAARLGVCRATAYRLCERGEIAHLRVSNAIRVSREALDSFLASKGQSAGGPRGATVAGGTGPTQLRSGRDDADPGGASLDCSPAEPGSSGAAGGGGSA